MTYRGHALGGGAAAVGTYLLFPTDNIFLIVVMAGMALFGSQMPDVDHRGSWIGRRLWPLHYLFKIIFRNPITWLLLSRRKWNKLGAHRGFTHTLTAFVLSSIMCAAVWSWGFNFLDIKGYLPSVLNLNEGASIVLGVEILFSMPVMFITTGWALGYISHLILDMSTVSGCDLLEPWVSGTCYVLPGPCRINMGRRED